MRDQYIDKAIRFLFLKQNLDAKDLDLECRFFLMVAYASFVEGGYEQFNFSIYELHEKLNVDSSFVTRSVKKLSNKKLIKVYRDGRSFYINSFFERLNQLLDESKLSKECPMNLEWFQREIIKSLLPETRFKSDGKTIPREKRRHPLLTMRDRAVLITMACLMNERLEITGYSHDDLNGLTGLKGRQIESHLLKFEKHGIVKTILPGFYRGTLIARSIYMFHPFYKPWLDALNIKSATFIGDGLYWAAHEEQRKTIKKGFLAYPHNPNYKDSLQAGIKGLIEGAHVDKNSNKPKLDLDMITRTISQDEVLLRYMENIVNHLPDTIPDEMIFTAYAFSVPVLKSIIESENKLAERFLLWGLYQIQLAEITDSPINMSILLAELVENTPFAIPYTYKIAKKDDRLNLEKLSDKTALLQIIKAKLKKYRDKINEQDKEILTDFYQALNASILGLAYGIIMNTRSENERKSVSKSYFSISSHEANRHIHLIGLVPVAVNREIRDETWFHLVYSKAPQNTEYRVKSINLREKNDDDKEEPLELKFDRIVDILKHIPLEYNDKKSNSKQVKSRNLPMFLQVIEPSREKN